MHNQRRPSCAPEMHGPKKGSLVLFPGAFCSRLLLIFLMWNLSSFSYGLGTEPTVFQACAHMMQNRANGQVKLDCEDSVVGFLGGLTYLGSKV